MLHLWLITCIWIYLNHNLFSEYKCRSYLKGRQMHSFYSFSLIPATRIQITFQWFSDAADVHKIPVGGQDFGWSNSAHAPRDTLPVAMGEGPTSALSLPPKIATERWRNSFFQCFSKVFSQPITAQYCFKEDLKTLGILSVSWHFLAQRTPALGSLCVTLSLSCFSELRQPVRAFMWGCWGAGWNWEVGCCQ